MLAKVRELALACRLEKVKVRAKLIIFYILVKGEWLYC